jgi:hypothetical protein
VRRSFCSIALLLVCLDWKSDFIQLSHTSPVRFQSCNTLPQGVANICLRDRSMTPKVLEYLQNLSESCENTTMPLEQQPACRRPVPKDPP